MTFTKCPFQKKKEKHYLYLGALVKHAFQVGAQLVHEVREVGQGRLLVAGQLGEQSRAQLLAEAAALGRHLGQRALQLRQLQFLKTPSSKRHQSQPKHSKNINYVNTLLKSVYLIRNSYFCEKPFYCRFTVERNTVRSKLSKTLCFPWKSQIIVVYCIPNYSKNINWHYF